MGRYKILIPILVMSYLAVSQGQAQSMYGTQIGLTYYDLPSNLSGFNRTVYNEDDQSVSVTWNQSITALPNPTFERGAGYNHFLNGTWQFGTEGACRVDNGCTQEYSGWPEIVNFPKKDVTLYGIHYTDVSHEIIIASTEALKKVDRTYRATGAWSPAQKLLIDQDICGLSSSGWHPRVVRSGDKYIHMVAIDISDNPGINPNCQPHSALVSPILYYRSSDKGRSWDIVQYVLPGLKGTELFAPNSSLWDQYAISANGSTVAIMAGGRNNPWVMWKSEDNGDSWDEPLMVHQVNPLKPDSVEPWWGSSYFKVSDGSFDVVVDDNGFVHCFSGIMNQNSNSAKVGSGIWYWSDKHEDMCYPTQIAHLVDYKDSNGNLHASPIHFGESGYDPRDYMAHKVSNYPTGRVSMPTASVDDQGNLYVVYSADVEGTHYNGNSPQDIDAVCMKDLYMVWSNDGGITWSKEINVADEIAGYNDGSGGTAIEEEVFPDSPQKIGSDQILHVTWNMDYKAGSDVIEGNGEYSQQFITYYGIDLTALTMQVGTTIQLNPNQASVFLNELNFSFGDTALISTDEAMFNMKPYVPFYQYIYDSLGVKIDSLDLNFQTDSIFVVLDSSSTFIEVEVDFLNACSNLDTLVNLNVVNGTPKAIIDPDTIFACEGDLISLFGYGSGDLLQNYQYQWIGGANSQSFDVVATTDTMYFFSVGAAAMDSIVIQVSTLPVADAGPPVTLVQETWCSGNIPTYADIGNNQPNANYSYEWTPYYGYVNSFYTIPNPTVEPWFTTKYTVTVTDNTSGCKSSDDVMVDVLLCPTGVEDDEPAVDVSVFPNPANNLINVSLGINGPVSNGSYKLFDSKGATIRNEKLNATNFEINTSSMAEGLYQLRIVLNDDIINKKIILIH